MNLAVLGAGYIVPEFLEAVRSVSAFEVTEIFGREQSREKVTNFAESRRIEKTCFDYDELLDDESIDVVYVALPNNLHYEYAKKALQHGKHAIVEKPFTATYNEAEDLIKTAQENHVMVFEAISNIYTPNYLETKDLVPDLGDIKLIQVNFSQFSHRYDQFKAGAMFPVFDPKQCGGALMDLNVYNIHFVTGIFGMPDNIYYYPNMERGIDTSGVLIMEYPSFVCSCIGAKDCMAPFSVTIQGDKGCIYSTDAANVYNSFYYKLNGGIAEEYSLNRGRHRLYYELRAFADMILKDDREKAQETDKQTLTVMQVLDEAKKSVR